MSATYTNAVLPMQPVTAQHIAATPAANAPSWVLAAQLEHSLQGSRSVPALHTAQQRARRLALAAALAKQHCDLGLSPPMPTERRNPQNSAAGAALASGLQHKAELHRTHRDDRQSTHAAADIQAIRALPAPQAQAQQQVPDQQPVQAPVIPQPQPLLSQVQQQMLQMQLWEFRNALLARAVRPPPQPWTGRRHSGVAKALRQPGQPVQRLDQQAVVAADQPKESAMASQTSPKHAHQTDVVAQPGSTNEALQPAEATQQAGRAHAEASPSHGDIHILPPEDHSVHHEHKQPPMTSSLAHTPPMQAPVAYPDADCSLKAGQRQPSAQTTYALGVQPANNSAAKQVAEGPTAGTAGVMAVQPPQLQPPHALPLRSGANGLGHRGAPDSRPSYVCGALAWPSRPGVMREISNQQQRAEHSGQVKLPLPGRFLSHARPAPRTKQHTSTTRRKPKARPCWDNCVLNNQNAHSGPATARQDPDPQHQSISIAATSAAAAAACREAGAQVPDATSRSQTAAELAPAVAPTASAADLAVAVSAPVVTRLTEQPRADPTKGKSAAEPTPAQLDMLAQLEQRMADLLAHVDAKLAQHAPQQHPALQAAAPGPPAGRQRHKPDDSGSDDAVQPAPHQQLAGSGSHSALLPRTKLTSPKDLTALLGRLDDIEQGEARVKSRWFPDASTLHQVPDAAPSEPPPQKPQAASQLAGQMAPAGLQHAQDSRDATPAAAVACESAADSQSRHSAAGTGQRSAVSEDMVERVMHARGHYVRHRQRVHAGLVKAGLRASNHLQVVEECADMLLEELLQESACEVEHICDVLADQLFANEFLEP